LADKTHVRELWAGDIDYIAAHLREGDRLEVEAVRGPVKMRDAIANSVMVSSHVWVIATPSEPLGILGVAPVSMLEGLGCPWMLATEQSASFPGSLMKVGRQYSRVMLEHYARLENRIDARNLRNIRWLERLGFTVHEPQPFGPYALPFHKFEIARDAHV
jgi:hypothetical protein